MLNFGRTKIDITSLEHSNRFDRLDETTQKILVALLNTQTSVLDGLQEQAMAVSQLLGRMETLLQLEQQPRRSKTNESHKSNSRRATATVEINAEGDLADQIVGTGRHLKRVDPITPVNDISKQNVHYPPDLWADEVQLRRRIDELVLRGLEFATMNNRYEAVTEAYFKTLEWVFEENQEEEFSSHPWSSFVEWLREGSGIYWINGKAGSGKSTLMRFIHDNAHTQELLRSWAGATPLTTASYFFWNSGTVEQASQAGLLRSLLFTILRQHRSLIPIVLPWHWGKCYSELASGLPVEDGLKTNHDLNPISASNSWPLSKLTTAFRQLLEQQDLPFKLCLFIDGIDEYEGNIQEICELFKNVAMSSNVKICTSSRPLLVIEDMYGSFPHLRLQDLTAKDIEFYVRDNLNQNRRFQQLSIDEPVQAPALIYEIASRADGVFLWVRLVVRSLIDGLGNHDGIDDLRRRLNLLPSDLEDLYKHMLARLDPFYLTQASELFQILCAAREVGEVTRDSGPLEPTNQDYASSELGPMTILTLVSTLEDLDLGPMKTDAGGEADNCEVLLGKAKTMVTKVKTRGAMLIEINEPHPDTPILAMRVQYLHRTVRNFLEKPDVWQQLLSHTEKSGFDPHSRLLRSCIYQLNAAVLLRRRGLVERLSTSLSVAMAHAYYAYAHTGKSNGFLLDQLNRLLKRKVVSYDLLDGINPDSSNVIIHLAVQYGLVAYVTEKIAEDPDLLKFNRKARPLLDYAIMPQQTSHFRFSAQLVTVLLQHGANPNKRFEGRSPWENALLWHYRSLKRTREQGIEIAKDRVMERLKIIRVLLEHGAKPNACCYYQDVGTSDLQVNRYNADLLDNQGRAVLVDHNPVRGYRSAWFMITNTFMRECPAETLELQTVLKNLGAKQHISYLKLIRVWLLYNLYTVDGAQTRQIY